ncbi:hypothetical protein ACIBL6_26025 [Streptomyces sp. NPDC050400]|uniref:hypothetical protein n=1 Tax=Streptomyces sp. NPDC050400 TaxID=3365610 RepID=UPI0037B21F45
MSVPHSSPASRLLADLEPLPYPRRTREIAHRARTLAATGELPAAVAELDRGGAYEQSVGALLACAGRDTAWAAGHLADPDPFVRGHARRAAQGLGVPDAAFEEALRDAPEAVRGELLRAIVAERRTALADRLVDGLRADWGDAAAGRLLAGCSPEVVARVLPDVFHAVRGWTGLVRRRPGTVLDVAERELAALPEASLDGWWLRYGPVLAALAKAAPLRVLDLLDARPPQHFPHSMSHCLGLLAAAAPGRVLRMATGPWRQRIAARLTSSALRTLARSGAPELAGYAGGAAERPQELAALLRAQAPADRPATYEAAVAGRGTAHRGVDSVLLDALPRRHAADVARAEARAARERGDTWLTVLLAESYLPPAEARAALAAATRRPVAEQRAAAWPLYVRNAARTGDPDRVTEAAEELARRLRNEQDPVRGAALGALADDVRPDLWSAAALPHLGRLAEDALQARDCSYPTRGALTRLAVGVLRARAADPARDHTDWALDTLVALHGQVGSVHLGRLDLTLRRGQEHQVYAALRPRIDIECGVNDHHFLLALARAVGRRAAGMPELQDQLRRAVERGDDSTAWSAIELWLEPRATRDERAAEVLALEPSAVELPCVAEVLARRRTDLLDRFLTGDAPRGRFLTDRRAWAFPAGGRVLSRWLPRQQRAYLEQLRACADDTRHDLWRRADAVRRGAHVPDGGRSFARGRADAPDVPLAEAALGALGATGHDLPLLLSHAGGDRARVAVYAATRATRHVPPSELAPLLDELLTGPGKKVTSRKEAARLTATRLPAPVAAPLLARAFTAPDAHRDVRAAAVAFAAYGLLGQDAAWRILAAAAHDGDAVLRLAALRLGVFDVAPDRRERYADLVATVADTDDDELAEAALTALASWVPWSPQAPALLARTLADVARPTPAVWTAAGRALLTAAAQSTAGADALTAAIGALMAHGAAPDAGEERDRPAHRRVEHVADQLADRLPRTPALRPVARTVAESLAGRDPFVATAVRVRLGAVDLADPGPGLRELAGLHDGRPVLAADTAGRLRDRLRRESVDGAGLHRVAGELAAGGTLAEGLFAWAVTLARGERESWPDRWRTQLLTLRSHPAPDVRDAAARVRTAP